VRPLSDNRKQSDNTVALNDCFDDFRLAKDSVPLFTKDLPAA
jgi:hypothetical protein